MTDVRVAILGADVPPLPDFLPNLRVTAHAADWRELVHSNGFPADLVILDSTLRERISLEDQIRTARKTGAKVLVLAGERGIALRAKQGGAQACVPKTAPLAELVRAARHVMGLENGHGIVAPEVIVPQQHVERPKLSISEEEALRLYTKGNSTNEIAASMNVQYETAKTYLRRIREKYAKVQRPASRKADLIQRATEDGFV